MALFPIGGYNGGTKAKSISFKKKNQNMNKKLISNSEQTQLNANKLIDIPIRQALCPVRDSKL